MNLLKTYEILLQYVILQLLATLIFGMFYRYQNTVSFSQLNEVIRLNICHHEAKISKMLLQLNFALLSSLSDSGI